MGVGTCSPIYASGDSPQATDTLYREVLGLTQDKVPNTLQSIHIHCFNGDEATVKLWSDAYPGTYFGFSSMVKPDRRTLNPRRLNIGSTYKVVIS